VPQDEDGDRLRVVQVELWQPGLHFRVAGDGDDIVVMRMDQRFADLASLDANGWRVKKGAPLFPKEELS